MAPPPLTRFEAAALRLAAIVGERECVLAGGLAVIAHGYVRATEDVDLVTRRPLREVMDRLAGHGVRATLKRGDPLEGDFPCVQGAIDGIDFDVLPELVPVAWEAAIPVLRGAAASLSVVDLETLIRLKLKAQGPQDLMDVAMLALLHPEVRSRALELATAYRAHDRLEAWLKDKRLRAQAREQARRARRKR